MYLWLLPLYMTLFVYQFVSPDEVSESIVYVTICASSFVHLFASVSWTFREIWLCIDKPCAFYG